MVRREIIEELEKLDNILSRDDYVVVYGAAMVLRDVKHNTHDIDITLTERGYNKLKEKEYKFEDYNNGRKIALKVTLSDKVDAFFGGFMTPIIAEEYRDFWIQTADSLIAEKLMRGREKDKDDVNSVLLRNAKLVIDTIN